MPSRTSPIFVPAVLVAHLLSISTPATKMAVVVYFFARLIHFLVYLAGIPAGAHASVHRGLAGADRHSRKHSALDLKALDSPGRRTLLLTGASDRTGAATPISPAT